jgi:hypothetical protein
MGRARYPETRSLVITADCGGSNGARERLWKRELQALANELGLTIILHGTVAGRSVWWAANFSRISPCHGCGLMCVQEP